MSMLEGRGLAFFKREGVKSPINDELVYCYHFVCNYCVFERKQQDVDI